MKHPARIRLFLLWVSLLMLASTSLPSQVAERTGPKLPSAEEILKKVLEQSTPMEGQDRYLYKARVVTETLNGEGEVEEREEGLYQVILIEEEPYHRLIEKNGQPLSEKQLKEEREREETFRQELAQAGEKKEGKEKQLEEASKAEEEDETEITLTQELLDRYEWKVLSIETVSGRPAYLLSFGPKDKKLPKRKKVDEFLNKLSGRLWVDTEEYQISRVEADSAGSIKIWWGLLGSMSEFQFAFGQKRLDSGEWVPEEALVAMKIRALLFLTERIRTRLEWFDYQERTAFSSAP